ncbi:MAG: YaeQ family protein [Polyangia bacterium]
MALSPTRLEYRVTLSHVDRARDVTETVYVARHPSETQRHVVLRMLAWCLLHEDGIAFGPGLSTPDAADLWTHDATGRLTTWIEVGTATAERLRKSLQHHSGAQAHVVVDDARAAAALKAELAEERWPRACPPPILWIIDEALVAALAEPEERRQRWAVTIVGDHFYIDIDGRTLNGAVVRG